MQAQAIQVIATENFFDAMAFAAFIESEGIKDMEEATERFQDAYAGTWDSLEEWAENFMEDAGLLESIPQNLRYYFDFQAYGRDCELSGAVWTIYTGGQIAVFWNH